MNRKTTAGREFEREEEGRMEIGKRRGRELQSRDEI